ncbi:MBL fold metallo-hydrolase [Methylobacterium sp. ID0610]|uniref:MBL fold metallo-hydrolase n=1 Tax=Methylobacterium carpenticola TaxID=3344827 RepID=UPI00369EEE3D
MQVRFFGTRGSLPVPGPRTIRYGGNTSCVALRTARGTRVILDMGTGAYALGRELAATGEPLRGHVLITHTHWDHIQGVPFFAPFFVPGNEWDIYAPRGLGASLRETLSGQMQYSYFPVALEQLGATIRYHDLVEGELTLEDDVAVETHYLNHPALTLGYRLTADGATVVYALDHEPFCAGAAEGTGALEGEDRRHAGFLRGADLAIHDAQYVAAEYPAKIGWGHSTIEYACRVAREAGAARLALMHHDPDRDDDALDALVARYRTGDLDLFAAAEGQTIDLSAARTAPAGSPVRSAREAVGSALAAQSVLLAADDPAAAESLAAILRGDGIGVHAAAPEPGAVAEAVLRHQPALAVLEPRSETPERVGALCAAIRALGPMGQDLPIVLVSPSDDRRGDEALGLSDRLVRPFTASYARTRLRAWLMRTACRWTRAAKPPGEAERIAALRTLRLLDTPAEERFDRIVALAARSIAAPFAALSLVDSDRQWFKANHGLPLGETPRDASLCAHVVAASDGCRSHAPLVVPDTLLDARFADNPAVTGPPYIRFYAGQPLILAEGHCIGTLCVADTRPRLLDPEEERRLRWLADLALAEIAPAPRA